MKDSLTVNLITVDRCFPPIECDYVKLSIADSVKGKFSGSYGIKRGHTRSVFSLTNGIITVYKSGKIIFKAETTDGFALIENDVLDVTVASVISVDVDSSDTTLMS